MTSSAGAPSGYAVPLAGYTTLRLGGPADRLVRATTTEALVEAVRAADLDAGPAGPRPLVLGGGSNVVVGDDGVPGTTVLVDTRGRVIERAGSGALLTAAAGEDWDAVVATAVAEGWSGLECLSGIPGRVGAVPVQNVGAYGVEIAELLVDVDLWDRRTRTVRTHVPAAELGLGYRTSTLKGRDEAVVLTVRLGLSAGPASVPLRFPELARALGVPTGARAPLTEVREAVLALRRSKGMVLDPGDHDTWSAGSFFTNPVVDAGTADRVAAAAVTAEMPRWPVGTPDRDGPVKLSAAWLISRAGFERGHPGPGGRVGLSTRHSLALTNRGGGTAADLLALAREVRDGVHARFGVRLTPEPVLVGCAL